MPSRRTSAGPIWRCRSSGWRRWWRASRRREALWRSQPVAAGAAPPRLQRVGLSATVRPLEVAARLLVGAARPLPAVVDVGQRRDLDLAVEVPEDELGAVCTNEQWVELYDRIAAL